MYRCITELKGLIIDVDSFTDVSKKRWASFNKKYRCVFITSDENTKQELETLYGKDAIVYMERFKKIFAPSNTTHNQVLDRLDCKTTEIVYISANDKFINNALGFMSGTIWIAEEITYDEASSSADLVCKDIDVLFNLLDTDIKGFLGEVALFPSNEKKGVLIPVEFDVDDESYLLCMIGRYFGYSHYMNQMHPYSRAIYLNKKEGKAYGVFNEDFFGLYKAALGTIKRNHTIDTICAVPSRPGKENRFAGVIETLANKFDLIDLTNDFICKFDYPVQKSVSQMEREENVKDIFEISIDLTGKHIVIIDDIITTGATMRECVRTLKKRGAEEIIIIVLGINQLRGNYWSSEVDEVKCPFCNTGMKLLVNSKNKMFFYSCGNKECNRTIGFEEGRTRLQELVNQKKIIDDNDDLLW